MTAKREKKLSKIRNKFSLVLREEENMRVDIECLKFDYCVFIGTTVNRSNYKWHRQTISPCMSCVHVCETLNVAIIVLYIKLSNSIQPDRRFVFKLMKFDSTKFDCLFSLYFMYILFDTIDTKVNRTIDKCLYNRTHHTHMCLCRG